MPSPGYIIAAVAASAAVTWGLRALPFTMISKIRRNRIVREIGRRLPLGIMIIVAVSTTRDIPLDQPATVLAEAVGIAATIGLHLWRRNHLLSIGAGTFLVVLISSLSAR